MWIDQLRDPIVVGDYNIRLHGEDLAAMSARSNRRGYVIDWEHPLPKRNVDRLTKPWVKGLIGSEAFSASSSAAGSNFGSFRAIRTGEPFSAGRRVEAEILGGRLMRISVYRI